MKQLVLLVFLVSLFQQPIDRLGLTLTGLEVYDGMYLFGEFKGYCATCLNYDYKEAVFTAGYSIMLKNGRPLYVYTYGGGYKLEDDIPVYIKPFWLPMKVLDMYDLDTCIDFTILGGSVTFEDGTKVLLIYEGKMDQFRLCIYNQYMPYIQAERGN